jgi:hypothetical protein
MNFYCQKNWRKAKPGNTLYIILGFVSSILGGILGIIAGYIYSRSKHKELRDGSYYVYDQRTRDLGTGMMLLGFAVIALTILFKLSD